MGFSLLRPKYAIALIVAISIDTLQFLLGVVIAAAFFHPATAFAILGCIVGDQVVNSCALGGVAGFVVGAVSSVLPGIGQALMAITDAIGAGLAAVVDFCISMIGFGIVIPMLIFEGIVVPGNFFKSWRRTPFMILKIIPGIDMLPFFTSMVLMSILEAENLKTQGKKVGIMTAAERAEATEPGSFGLTKENRGARYVVEQARDIRQAGQRAYQARSVAPFFQDIRASSSERRSAATTTLPELWNTAADATSQSQTLRENNTASKQLMSDAALA